MICDKCGFYDIDYEACTCPEYDKWYACLIINRKSKNIKALEEYAKQLDDARHGEKG